MEAKLTQHSPSPKHGKHSAMTASQQNRNNAQSEQKGRKEKSEMLNFVVVILSAVNYFMSHTAHGAAERENERNEEKTTLHFAFRYLIHISCLCESFAVNFLHVQCARRAIFFSFARQSALDTRKRARRGGTDVDDELWHCFKFIVATNMYIFCQFCVQ